MSRPLSNAVDYIEIPASDISVARDFFKALMEWQFTDYGPDYTSFNDGRLSGGFYTHATVPSTISGSVLVVFFSEDLEKSLARVQSLGGVITKEIFHFPGGRRFQFNAPGTGEFAIWSDRLH